MCILQAVQLQANFFPCAQIQDTGMMLPMDGDSLHFDEPEEANYLTIYTCLHTSVLLLPRWFSNRKGRRQGSVPERDGRWVGSAAGLVHPAKKLAHRKSAEVVRKSLAQTFR